MSANAVVPRGAARWRGRARVLRVALIALSLVALVYATSRYGVVRLVPDTTSGEPRYRGETRFLVDRHAKPEYRTGQLVIYGFAGEDGERIGRVLAVGGQVVDLAPALEGPGEELLVDGARQGVFLRPELDRPESCRGAIPGEHVFFVNLGGASRDPDARTFGARPVAGTVGRPLFPLPF